MLGVCIMLSVRVLLSSPSSRRTSIVDVNTTCIIEKISPFCLVLGCASETVTPTFFKLFYNLLDLLHQCTKFPLQSMVGSLT